MNESTKPAVTWSIMKVNRVLYVMIINVNILKRLRYLHNNLTT